MVNSHEREFYESPALWREGARQDAGNMQRFSDTVGMLPEGARSLVDVGCGDGAFGDVVVRSRPEVQLFGVDRSETALARGAELRVRADASCLPFGTRSVDCVTCLEVLEHLPTSQFDRAKRELARVARDAIIIGVPYRERTYLNSTECPMCRTRFNVDLHLRSFDDAAIETLFDDLDFRLVSKRFPASSRALVGIAQAWNLRRRRRVARLGFRAPICPVCGFTSDAVDRATPQQAELAASGRSGVAAARAILRFWPRYSDPGYWVVARYDRV